MKNIQRKTDLSLIALINDLKAAERETGSAIWRDIAERLEKPRKNWAETNLSKLGYGSYTIEELAVGHSY
jgi:large subunit ribosomal protein L18e